MAKKNKYVVISNVTAVDKSWEQSIADSLGICHTLKKAYEISTFLAGITKPDINYRKTLDLMKNRGAVTIRQVDGDRAATIVNVKIY